MSSRSVSNIMRKSRSGWYSSEAKKTPRAFSSLISRRALKAVARKAPPITVAPTAYGRAVKPRTVGVQLIGIRIAVDATICRPIDRSPPGGRS